MTADGCPWRPVHSDARLGPSERCGDGRRAGREGICWSVVSNGLRRQRSSEDASIPGVACRSLIAAIPVHPAHRQKATQRRPLPGTATLRAPLPARDEPAKGVVPVPRRRFFVLVVVVVVVVVDRAVAASTPAARSACLAHRRSCLGRRIQTSRLPPSVCVSSDWEEITTPAPLLP